MKNHIYMLRKKRGIKQYEGAIVIVSHDPNMVERVADRLWVVRDGACVHFDGDLEDYRNFTIQARRDKAKDSKKKKEKTVDVSAEVIPLKAADPKLEKKIESLEAHKEELETLMSADGFYTKPLAETKNVQDMHAQVVAELEAMEEQWLQALAG